DGFLDTHKNANGVLSREDDATYAQMESTFQDLTNEIQREQRRQDMEREMERPVSMPLTARPMVETNVKKGRFSEAYKRAMLEALRSNFTRVSDALQEGIAESGGYLVPDEYDKRLIEVMNEDNVMRTLSTIITTSGEHKINIADTAPAAAWIEEGGAISFGEAKFDQVILDAHKLHVAIKITDELLYDNAFDLENYILRKFGEALANAEEDAFINGTGTGQPLGILADKGGAQTGVTTASATAITSDEILDLVYSLKRPYRKNAKFLCNDQTLLAIRKLKDNNGTYIWQPSYQSGEPDRVLGYPVYTSAYFPSIETGKAALAFGDFKYYNIGDRGTRVFMQLKELFAGNGMVGYLARERVDGKLVLPEAIKLLKMA
ncbi:MAG: phage major capsid protein, partial [Clostridia bacterium]|nr:phage major capsid protein [Clostridia bacterium]